jgi:hypothetical protein
MTGFLARLAARQIAPGGGLRPRAVSRFAAPEAEASPDEPPLLVAPVPAVMPPSPPASPEAAVPKQVPAALQAARGDPDAAERRAPHPVLRAPEPASPGEDQPRSPLSGERDSDDRERPRNGRVAALAQVAPAAARTPEHPPNPAPLVPREIVRARETTAQHAPVAARAAVAPMPTAVEAADAPVVRVTIGRIEVRAAAPAPAREKRPAARPKTMSLDEYLDRRHGTRR